MTSDYGGDRRPIALTGATIYTMDGAPIMGGTIVAAQGKILAVGDRITLPADCRMIDVQGAVITPGLIDAHCHLGIAGEGNGWAGEDFNEATNPVLPGLDVVDAIHPRDAALEEAWRSGVTTVMVAPGSANPIGGQCAVIKTKAASRVDDMVLRRMAGLKISFGENPRRIYGEQKKTPATRMGVAYLVREAFLKAREYLARQDAEDFRFDLNLEAIARVLRHEMPVRAHAHRADDIVTAIRLAREFDIELVIEHATEAHLIPDVLAREEVPVVLGPLLTAKRKSELRDRSWEAPYVLNQYGVPFAIMSDHPVLPAAFLPVYAGLTCRYGLPEDQALAAITSNAAKILGVDDRVGKLVPEMDADLVVWSEFPLSLQARPLYVMTDGVLTDLEED